MPYAVNGATGKSSGAESGAIAVGTIRTVGAGSTGTVAATDRSQFAPYWLTLNEVRSDYSTATGAKWKTVQQAM
jgi:hypothetical protein